MSTFAATFRALVMPDLRRACREQALYLVRRGGLFSEAVAPVWRMASARGATYLPDHLVAELDDWIATTILRTVTEIETDESVARAIIDEGIKELLATTEISTRVGSWLTT